MKFILITNNPSLASYAEKCGVSRIFVDLEVHGKQERQGHLDTLISQHSMSDVAIIRRVLSRSELLVRLNPIHHNTQLEIDQAIESGADLLMLPMFRSAVELHQFSRMVGGRAGIVPLVETHDAVMDMERIVQVPGLKEIYIGLNDLHLDIGLTFMFELLTNGMLDKAIHAIKTSKIPFGIGGVARIGEGLIPGELVLAEHVRLGSDSVILSRTFHQGDGTPSDTSLGVEVNKLVDTVKELNKRTVGETADDRLHLKSLVDKVVELKS